jgi:nitrile hydratase beta subunit
MNGMHDLGGMHGFGPVVAEKDEPVFHWSWERRVFAMNLAIGVWRRWNLDQDRDAREQMPPHEYLGTTYYEHWLFGLFRLLSQFGLLQADEVQRAQERPATIPEPANPRVQDGALHVDDVPRVVNRLRGARMDDPVTPRYVAGQAVVTRNMQPIGHTRLPRYARGRRGTVDRDHGVFRFPDTSSRGEGPKPQHVYSVMFEARELWGPDANARDRVYLDLWDDYLEPV